MVVDPFSTTELARAIYLKQVENLLGQYLTDDDAKRYWDSEVEDRKTRKAKAKADKVEADKAIGLCANAILVKIPRRKMILFDPLRKEYMKTLLLLGPSSTTTEM